MYMKQTPPESHGEAKIITVWGNT